MAVLFCPTKDLNDASTLAVTSDRGLPDILANLANWAAS